MTNCEFKRKASAFKSSCRVYRKEKKRTKELEGQFPGFRSLDFKNGKSGNDFYEDNSRRMLDLYQLLREDTAFVEDTFQRIEEICGTGARDLLWSLFVEQKVQTNVAEDFGLTRRQVQYSVDKWLREVFDNA